MVGLVNEEKGAFTFHRTASTMEIGCFFCGLHAYLKVLV